MKTPARILDFESYLTERLKEDESQASESQPVSPFAQYGTTPGLVLDYRRIAHRRRMLEHLRRSAS